jgi:hypothetical protein
MTRSGKDPCGKDPNIKLQDPIRYESPSSPGASELVWSLELDVYLDLGAWILVFEIPSALNLPLPSDPPGCYCSACIAELVIGLV